MPRATQPPIKNRILASLPAREYNRMLKHLTPVSLPLGETIYNTEERITEVYFVGNGVVSLVANLKGGGSSVVAHQSHFAACRAFEQ
jgi:CRP-like cAMP-binding protein